MVVLTIKNFFVRDRRWLIYRHDRRLFLNLLAD